MLTFSKIFTIIDEKNELRKVAIARIFVSLVVAHRTYLNIADYSKVADFDFNLFVLYALLAVSLLAAVGLLSTFFAMMTVTLYFISDKTLGIHGLGSAALANVMLIIVLIPSGHYYSIDRLLRKREGVGVIDSLRCSPTFIQNTYICAFFIFAISNLASLAGHALSENWIDLSVIEQTFKNPFYSKYYSFFLNLEGRSDFAFSFLSRLSTIFQMLWQLLMIPMIFFKFGRYIVMLWGFAFFLMSEIFLNLGYLDMYLFALWSLLFIGLPNLFPRVVAKEKRSLQRFVKFPFYIVFPFFLAFTLASSSTAFQLFKITTGASNSNSSPMAVIKSELSDSTLFLHGFANFVGLGAPNVFNKPDMDAAFIYLILERFDAEADEWALVPFTNYEGGRLKMHRSDLVRYKYSIPLRRCLQSGQWKRCITYVRPIAKMDQDGRRGGKYRAIFINKIISEEETFIFN
ncbi:hypothetical protein N9X39_03715 [Alphaproteobacteria bacterium]|nr:hypothetical protein [Alphaproteobacteria bacterium]